MTKVDSTMYGGFLHKRVADQRGITVGIGYNYLGIRPAAAESIERTEKNEENFMGATHCIVLGSGASALLDYEFVLRTQLSNGAYSTLRTIMTH